MGDLHQIRVAQVCCSCWRWWQVTGNIWHVTHDTRHTKRYTSQKTCYTWLNCYINIFFYLSQLFWIVVYWCSYPHTLKNLVSPICGIFYRFYLLVKMSNVCYILQLRKFLWSFICWDTVPKTMRQEKKTFARVIT